MVSEAAQDELDLLESIYQEKFNFQAETFTVTFECRMKSIANIRILSYPDVEVDGKLSKSNLDQDHQELQPLERKEDYVHAMEVKYLSPIVLSCRYNPSYPASECVSVSLSCVWLGLWQIEAVEQQLISMFTAEEPVVFEWITWLEQDMLEFLNIVNEIHLNDNGGYQLCQSLIMANVAHFDIFFFREEFENELAECLSCYAEFPGSKMVLLNCDHPFCLECMKMYLGVKLKDGDSLQFNCPDCGEFIGREVLLKLLDDADFVRWETLFTDQSLERAGGVLFCPRCSTHAVKDDIQSTLAECVNCSFTFCDLCELAWHPGNCEGFGEMLLEVSVDTTGDAQAQSTKHKQKIKEFEFKSEHLKRKHCRKCPSCKSWIQRDDGCNRMDCTICGTSFCYVCGKLPQDHTDGGYCINCMYCGKSPKYHINGSYCSSKLGDQRFARRGPKVANVIDEVLSKEPIISCVRCRNKLQRQNKNNHMSCVVCKAEFCYCCRELLKGTKHFNAVGCPQHGEK